MRIENDSDWCHWQGGLGGLGHKACQPRQAGESNTIQREAATAMAAPDAETL